MIANVLLSLEQHSEAVAEAEKALAVSPNDANVLALGAYVLSPTGRANEAYVLMQRAFRLDPFPPPWYYGALGDSLLFSNQVERAIPAHKQCTELTPDFIWCRLGLSGVAPIRWTVERLRDQA